MVFSFASKGGYNMDDEYSRIYDELIRNKSKYVIVDYDPQSKNHIYRPFRHNVTATALNDLYNLIIDNIVFYAYSENEIMTKNEMGMLEDLRAAAMYAFSERLPKRLNPDSDGTVGEVLLDLIIQVFEPKSQKLIARAKLTEVEKRKYEITGYDALYFTLQDEQITLWLGQAKAGTEQYCKKGIKEDLNTKFTLDYFADTAFYIADRSESPELTSLLKQINKVCFEAQKNKWTKTKKIDMLLNLLIKNNVKIRIPCLLAYTSDIYKSDDINREISDAVNKMQKYYDKEHFKVDMGLPYEIRFYIFPIKDVSSLRNRLVKLKKEVV